MPRDLSEEAVAEWMVDVYYGPGAISPGTVNKARGALEMQRSLARAVRALVEATGEKVARQAYHAGYSACVAGIDVTTRIDADVYFILARVLGDHPSRSESASDAAIHVDAGYRGWGIGYRENACCTALSLRGVSLRTTCQS
jgi:hypothetical protein